MNENKTNINWTRRNLAKLISNLYKISIFTIRLFAYFCQKDIKEKINVK